MSNYYDYREVKVMIAHKLMDMDGWTVYGYHADESDSMTDYWNPASWGGVADLSYPNSNTRRGRVQENGTIAPTITATETGICKIETPIRIRKLIPLEAFRLMGFYDEQFYKAMIGVEDKAKNFIQEHPHLIGKTILNEAETIQGISNSQLYKMAGNSIVVDVLFCIMIELYKAMPYLFNDLKLSSFFSGIGAFEVALDRLYDEIKLLRKEV